MNPVSSEAPMQKNYAFLSKEPNAFKVLKQLNKTRRRTLDLKNLEGQYDSKASEEYFTHNYSKNFNSHKRFMKEKENKFSENSKEKDIDFVKNHYGITQKSIK